MSHCRPLTSTIPEPPRLCHATVRINGFSCVTEDLIKPFEVEAPCVLVSADVYSFLTFLKVMVFDSDLILIPLCNRGKQRYACGLIGAKQD
jgi:hypothetical protein